MAGRREGNGNRKVTVEELLQEMHRTVDGLAEDGAGRANLKLLSRSLRASFPAIPCVPAGGVVRP
ncbi:MAG: hypothetical protein H6Q81_2513 [Deltaproteobacteria bacterium]|nr:hypothetical protein [Deltaproteobacteria bacterium]